MVDKHILKMLNDNITETQIKTTIGTTTDPTKMAIIFKMENNKYWWTCRKSGSPHALLMRMENGAATVGKEAGSSSKS